MSPYPLRIKALREARGLSPHEVANALGINVSCYFDLEAFEDELETTLDLKQVQTLASNLNVSLRELVSPDDRQVAEGAASISFADLAASLQVAVDHFGLNKVEDDVGWGLVGFLATADAWDAPLFFLIDVCSYLKLDWFDAIPDTSARV